jgi:uncharacterized DUF497 family protein
MRDTIFKLTRVRFTWDPNKAESNARKHGVTFEEAVTVFDDPFARYRAQRHGEEPRFVVVGYSAANRCLFVVSVEFGNNARIVTARKATRHEEKLYEEDRYR